ncbi:MAG: hypothetical protein ABJL55_15055 [Roseibium sp.]
MTDATENLPEATSVETPENLRPSEPVHISRFRRDLFPSNVVLSADDLREFCELLKEANERAKDIEFQNLSIDKFESPEQARERVDEFVRLEYRYVAMNGDSMNGLDIPRTNERTFPDDLLSLFVSNASYTERAIETRPLNTVESFIDFEKPSLKIDLQTLPSNPTNNRSVINVVGQDEDWVISTADRIERFFKKRAAIRPLIHRAGTYDYLVFLVLFPIIIWFLHRLGPVGNRWLEKQTVFLNVLLGVYALFLILLFARFVYQYIRWLFPSMEYYKRSRIGAYIHRSIAAVVGSVLLFPAAYDLAKSAFLWVFDG